MEVKRINATTDKQNVIEKIKNENKLRKLKYKQEHEDNLVQQHAHTGEGSVERGASNEKDGDNATHHPNPSQSYSLTGIDVDQEQMDTVIQSMINQRNEEIREIEQNANNKVFLSDEYKKGVEDIRKTTDVELKEHKNTIKYLEYDLQAVCSMVKQMNHAMSVMHSALPTRNKQVIQSRYAELKKEYDNVLNKIEEVYKKRTFGTLT